MSLFNLTDAERKLIRSVAAVSIAGCVLVSGGIYIYYRVQLSPDGTIGSTSTERNRSAAILPIDIEAHRALAGRYMDAGVPEQAVIHLKRAYSLQPNDHQLAARLAHASLEAGYYGEALRLYDLVAEKAGDDAVSPRDCARRGIALFFLNRSEESRGALLSCLEKEQNNAEAFCFLGQIEASRELPSQKALDYFNQSIEADSTYAEAWYQLGRYYMQQSVYIRARELFLTAIAVNPFHAKSHSRLGMVYYYLDYPHLAKKSYQTALALNPLDFNTWYNFGELLYSVLGDTVEALVNYQKAIDLNPKLHEAAFRIGLIAMNNGMYKEAIRSFEQALQNVPADTRILLQCAVAREKIGDTQKALELYHTIVGIDELHSIARQKIRLLSQR